MTLRLDETAEWLEADGMGGFATGAAPGLRTRRYHALLTVATRPPTDRRVLINSVQVFADVPGEPEGRYSLSSERYSPGVIHPLGMLNLSGFEPDPWPTWVYVLDDGTQIEHALFVPRGAQAVCLSWRVRSGRKDIRLRVRPMLSGRDYHALHHENPALRFDASITPGRTLWRTYPSVPAVTALHTGEYRHAPVWHTNFLYEQERARGFPWEEDLASPGEFRLDLSGGEQTIIFAADMPEAMRAIGSSGAKDTLTRLRDAEKARRAGFRGRLDRAADDYIVPRTSGKTVLAGYPWFTDWGRDTFISLPGLCIATGRAGDARDILLEWSTWVSEGMLPNRFPDAGETPEYNSVDAALWFIDSTLKFMTHAEPAWLATPERDRERLLAACEAILDGCARGARHGIRMDDDGLLAAGEPGVQLTWMDAKIGDHIVTPRIGKPVEIQALWISALAFFGGRSARWLDAHKRASASFEAKFWNERERCLFDVADANHMKGERDGAIRPNQIFAVGGVQNPPLVGARARAVVDCVETRLLTPMGLRTLAPEDPAYRPRYEGGPWERDTSYHQGTAWPWLTAPFAEAWLRTRDAAEQPAARDEARERFLNPLLESLSEAGLGHISEIADGDPPHTPRGCPFQAWSLAGALWMDRVTLKLAPGAAPASVTEARGPSARVSAASRVKRAFRR